MPTRLPHRLGILSAEASGMDSSSRSGPLSRTDVASWPAFPCADAQQYIHAACFQQRRAYAALISARRSSATTTTTTTTQRQRQRRLHQQTNTTHVAPSLPPPFPPLPGSSSEDLEPLGPQCKRPIISTNSLDFLDAPEALEASYRGHAIIRTVAWWIATSLSCHGSTEPLPPLVSGAVRQLRVSQPGAPGRRRSRMYLVMSTCVPRNGPYWDMLGAQPAGGRRPLPSVSRADGGSPEHEMRLSPASSPGRFLGFRPKVASHPLLGTVL